jgi:hypothetical protein
MSDDWSPDRGVNAVFLVDHAVFFRAWLIVGTIPCEII